MNLFTTRLTCFLGLCALVGIASGQVPQFEWVRLIASTNYGFRLDDIAIDGAGDIYVNGDFGGSVSFGTTNLTSHPSRGSAFIAKYTASGTLLWAAKKEASATNGLAFYGLTVDAAGNSYTCGVISRTNVYIPDYFVAKFDRVGREIWFHQYGHSDTNVDDYASKLVVNRQRECFVIGGYSGGAVGVGAFSLSKYDTNGLRVWVREVQRLTSSSWAGYSDVAIDPDGSIWVTGYFYGPIMIGGTQLRPVGSANFLLAKYDTTGTLLLLKHFGQTGSDKYSWSSGISCDAGGNAYVTGHFTGTASLGTTNLVSTSDDFFLLKCNPSGDVVWGKQIRGVSGCWSSSVAVAPSGDVILVGSFPNSLDFGSVSLVSRGEMDVFVASYDRDGDFLWARQGGGTGYDCSIGLAVDTKGAAYVIGQLRGSGLFGNTNVLANNGDWFIAKASPTFRLNTTTAGGGTVAASPMEGGYLSNTLVTLTATPAPGWTFLQWLGDATGTNSITTVRMVRDRCVEAVFGTSLIDTVVGSGSVSRSPSSSLYPYGTRVRFTALAVSGNYFDQWANAANGKINPLHYTVTNANATVAAEFAALPGGRHALAVRAPMPAIVDVSPRASHYESGAKVTLTAIPVLGQTFLGWGGSLLSTENPLTVTMDASKEIMANFTPYSRLEVLTCCGVPDREAAQLLLRGDFNRYYVIEATTTIGLGVTNWTSLGIFSAVNGAVQVKDLFVTNRAQRFYRAFPVP